MTKMFVAKSYHMIFNHLGIWHIWQLL